MHKGVRPLWAVAAVAAAFALASCGDTVIDDGKAEDAVKADVQQSLDVTVTSVECPSDVKVEAGTTFDCIVTADNGRKAKATLKIINSDADVKFIDLRPVK